MSNVKVATNAGCFISSEEANALGYAVARALSEFTDKNEEKKLQKQLRKLQDKLFAAM